MHRFLLAALLFILPLVAHAQSAGTIQAPARGQPLLGVGPVNQAMTTKADVQNGTLNSPIIDGRAMLDRDQDFMQAARFGVKCDGTTNDSPALQAIINTASALGGRHIMLPATGHACYLAQGIILSDGSHSGVVLEGSAGGMYWPGPYDNNEADWEQHGTWIRCGDLTNACITMGGNGARLSHISFWYTQPTPPASSGCGAFCNMTHNWAPTNYPFTVLVNNTQNFQSIDNINVVNGANCIDFEGGATGVNTIYTYVEHVHLGCFNTVAKFNRIDNVIDVHDWHDNLWWFPFSSDVIGWTEGDTSSPGHRIGWDAYYLANLQGTGIEFYQDATAIRATDASVGSGLGTVTIGMQDVSLANVDFNQVCQAVQVTGPQVHMLRNSMVGVHLNVDPQTSNGTQCSAVHPNAFDLSTQNLNMQIAQLQVGFAQTIAAVGAPGTTGGTLHINGMSADNYSAYAAGGSAFLMQGGYLDAPGGFNWLFSQNSAAGPHVAGSAGGTTMTGLNIEGLNNTERAIGFFDAPANGSNFAIQRWQIDHNGQGGRFQIKRFDATGAYQDTPVDVDPTSGQVYFVDGLKATLPTACPGTNGKGVLYNNAGAVQVCP